jgi:hypothetical protein
MLKSLDDAVNISTSLVLDDSANLLRLIIKHGLSELHEFNVKLKQKAGDKNGFYFSSGFYKFYNPKEVSEIIDYICEKKPDTSSIKKYPITDILLKKLVENANPSGYFAEVRPEEKEDY